MVEVLAVNLVTSNIQPRRFNPVSLVNVINGGVLDREIGAIKGQGSHRSIQFRNNQYIIFASGSGTWEGDLRIYKKSETALKILLTGDPTVGLPVAGDTVTGVNSSATGTLIEDYYAGDNFIKYEPTSGTFQDSEVVNFTGSGSNSATTTASSNPIDNLGEWGVVWDSVVNSPNLSGKVTTGDQAYCSGLYHVIGSNGKHTLGAMWCTSTDVWYSLLRDSESETWTAVNISARTGTTAQGIGHSIFHKGSIYLFGYEESASDVAILYTMDPVSGALTQATRGTTDPDDNHTNHMSRFVVWHDRVWLAHWSDTGDKTKIYEVTGGTFNIMGTIVGSGFGSNNNAFLYVGPDDNALYVLFDRSGVIHLGRWIMDTDGSTPIRTCPINSNTEGTGLGLNSLMLPAAVRTGLVAAWTLCPFTDMETTPGTLVQRLFFFDGQQNIVGPASYAHTNWSSVDSDLAATWNGTTGNANDVVFQNSVAATLAVGDWILHVLTGKVFRVEAVSTTNVEISNQGTAAVGGFDIVQTVPTDSSAVTKAETWASTAGATPNLVGIALPSDDAGGGGYIFTPGEISADYVGNDLLISNVRIKYTINDPASLGLTDRVARGYYLKTDRTLTQMTLSNTSGTQVGNTDTALAADNGVTEHYFDWESPTDGIANGELVHIAIRITAP